jgi:hypothetical protein
MAQFNADDRFLANPPAENMATAALFTDWMVGKYPWSALQPFFSDLRHCGQAISIAYALNGAKNVRLDSNRRTSASV